MAFRAPSHLLLLLLRRLGGPCRGLASEEPREALPVIRIPQPLQLRREARARGGSAPRVSVPRPGPLLIAARRPEFSQPLRLTVGRWERAPLASRGWKHRRSRGDHFSIERTHRQVPALPVEAGAVEEKAVAEEQHEERGAGPAFAALGLQPRVLDALHQAAPAVVRPTWVQRRAIPPLLRGRHLLCAAETGSGKTLSYLLPLLQRLLRRPRLTTGPAPRGLVLVPSRELSEQVRAVAGSLGQGLELCVREIGGGRGMGSVKQQLSLEPLADLLVATPGALWKALKRQLVSLEQLCFLVLDEADTLLDESFLELVEYILGKSPIAENLEELEDPFNPRAQLVLVGATFPEGVGELLSKVTDLGNLTTVTSPRLHCVMPHVRQKFLRLKGSEKVTELIQALKLRGEDNPGSSGAILVFCNSSSTVNWLGYILDDHKIPHLRLQGQMPAAMRAGIFQSFQNGTKDILLCTDIASRGLDSTRVELVINYDFPPTLQDYIHRAGRVGRVGSEVLGSVLSFVTHRWDVDLVQKIELAARRRRSLPGIKAFVKEPLPPIELTPDLDRDTENVGISN
ncbi:probable ATP-dependent RNA helicase DDX28 [Gracilinanus agilis]|uniref:probable ATP-dependent RNA helicase DDX28 n=1 Tax=Gracilinanus agilis TaxID=191870 RepID=UPI001CFD20A9|nr:probable ATP-dependent RNA helicase DDX28 [Gracilinanus agilis]